MVVDYIVLANKNCHLGRTNIYGIRKSTLKTTGVKEKSVFQKI